jgi:hypothetical protein
LYADDLSGEELADVPGPILQRGPGDDVTRADDNAGFHGLRREEE